MDRGSERKVPHTGTEIRTRLLREAAVRNIGQWAGRLNQPSRVKDDGLTGCKLLLDRNKGRYVYLCESTVGISIG